MIRICHTCYQHNRYDTRVFWKECVSLAKNKNYKVYFVVADGLGDEVKMNVNIVDTGLSKDKFPALERIQSLLTTIKNIKPKIIHFHSPSLIKKFIKKDFRKNYTIIYDAHEDPPRHYWDDTKDKGILKLIRYWKIVIKDILAAYHFDQIITVVDPIAKKFKRFTSNIEVVFNYPIISELISESPWNDRKDEVCYVGGLTHRRGIHNMVEAAKRSRMKLNLAGKFNDPSYGESVKRMSGWNNTNFYGYVDRNKIRELFSRSKIGLLNLLWTKNHEISQPIKMYEYMLAGLPIVYSDFEEWRKVLQPLNCGIAVPHDDVNAISEAIKTLQENNEIAKEMGQRGKAAVLEKYNWSTQEEKLLRIYKRLEN